MAVVGRPYYRRLSVQTNTGSKSQNSKAFPRFSNSHVINSRATGARDTGELLVASPLSSRSDHLCTSLDKTAMADSNTRIAIIDANKCRPKRCAQECKKVNSKYSK